MSITIYRREIRQPSARPRFERFVELTIKCIILFLIPLPFAAGITAAWYYWLFKNGIYFNGEMEAIITCAWIPVFGIVYGLMVSTVLSTVWGEYKAMRAAIKRGDIEEFIVLRDERVSPLIYALIVVLTLSIMSGFLVIKYPSVIAGVSVIASTAYLFILIIVVISEIDDPCAGLWYIRRLPEKWRLLNAESWRKEQLTAAQEKYAERIEKHQIRRKRR